MSLPVTQKLNDLKERLVGVPLVSLLGALMGGADSFRAFGKALLISFFITISLWHLVRLLVIRIRVKYPGIQNTRQRIIHQGLVTILVSGTFMILFCYAYTWIRLHQLPSPKTIWLNTITGLLITLLVSTIYEAAYFFGEWKKSIVESEQLKRRQLFSQFETLKSQINPHFLFNSLNTLIALIEENSQQAVQFVQQLSQVYRYVLLSREKNTVSLHDELEFIRAYIHLLQIRFGENFQVNIAITENFLNHQLPPLSLQLLIENVIKHNIISANQPLTLTIRTDDDQVLIIENAIQKKQHVEPSSGFGLNTIAEQYRLLDYREIRIEKTENLFRVILPLTERSVV